MSKAVFPLAIAAERVFTIDFDHYPVVKEPRLLVCPVAFDFTDAATSGLLA